jgi:hypothetical protein
MNPSHSRWKGELPGVEGSAGTSQVQVEWLQEECGRLGVDIAFLQPPPRSWCSCPQ